MGKENEAREEGFACILHGHSSNSATWDAELYKPKTVVLPKDKYDHMMAMKKALKEQKKLKIKQELLLSLQKKKKIKAAKLAEKTKLAQLRKQKISRIVAAKTQLHKAKANLHKAITSAPVGEGLVRYEDSQP